MNIIGADIVICYLKKFSFKHKRTKEDEQPLGKDRKVCTFSRSRHKDLTYFQKQKSKVQINSARSLSDLWECQATSGSRQARPKQEGWSHLQKHQASRIMDPTPL